MRRVIIAVALCVVALALLATALLLRTSITDASVSSFSASPPGAYDEAVRALDLGAVRADLKALFRDSKDEWPADYGHYGPLMIRLAWHCAGSYRLSDGRGGCTGARQRFDPERSWPDNTNLDKARYLLEPIKAKYGVGLSWGDLIVLAGTTAIEDMGGPSLGFCAGRPDDGDGTESLPLGPTPEQEARFPCAQGGNCQSPLGATTMGLIYVNPEGHQGQPDPKGSVPDVRSTFARMSMNDTETVALIGGGHAFGKAHGACPAGAGPSPKESPHKPWPGRCGSGKGPDTFTSGIEGPWTADPTTWDNKYFTYLKEKHFEKHVGPGGAHQWRVAEGDESPMAPAVDNSSERVPIMMMTTDLSLLEDPSFKAAVDTFAAHPEKLDEAFAHAWYKLVTRDMGPHARCVGILTPAPQPWQHPLPAPAAELANMTEVAAALRDLVASGADGALEYPAAELSRLAYHCAATYRATDARGGCSGARIRFPPQSEWPWNAGLDAALKALEPVKAHFGDGLSWADLIVLAGQVALETAGAPEMRFCPGRADAEGGADSSEASAHLEPVLGDDVNATAHDAREAIALSGLTAREWVALRGRRALGVKQAPYAGPWTTAPESLTAEYFVNLVDTSWEPYAVPGTGAEEFKAPGQELFTLQSDLVLAKDDELLRLAKEFARDEGAWLREFAAAWVKLMNIERYEGPTKKACNGDSPASAA